MAKIRIELSVEPGTLSKEALQKLRDKLDFFIGEEVLDIVTGDLLEVVVTTGEP